MQAWEVFLNRSIEHPTTGAPVGPGCIDTVYSTGCDADYIKRSLVNHDGYPDDIVVRAVRFIRNGRSMRQGDAWRGARCSDCND